MSDFEETSTPSLPPKSSQSDDIRTRIAAAIREVDDMRVCKLSDADIKFIVEAVIHELKDQCGQCWRRGDERDGCNCVYPKGHRR